MTRLLPISTRTATLFPCTTLFRSYVTHYIGSFLGPPRAGGVCNGTLGHTAHLPDDLYLRWLQFGVFQPLLRLHSSHGDRLPWDYDDATAAIAADFLRLRERLVPQLYSLARASYDDGLPIARGDRKSTRLNSSH